MVRSNKITYSGQTLRAKLKNGKNIVLRFGKKAEVLCHATSPDGRFLKYTLQQYRPNVYELILHNLVDNKEEWRYVYPKNQVSMN